MNFVGCVEASDCKYHEECLHGQCTTLKCDPIDTIPNGNLELKHGSVMFNDNKRNTATLRCQRGYVFDSHPEQKVSHSIYHENYSLPININEIIILKNAN